MTKKQIITPKFIAILLIICGVIGLLASSILTIDEIKLLKDPSASLGCDLNPVVGCGSVITTDQASVFGFPNPMIGIAAFSSLATIGAMLLAGATFKLWLWRGLQVGATFGLLFVHWFIFQSLYVIGSLCPYCMSVWVITTLLFWYLLLYNLQEKHIVLPDRCIKLQQFALQNHFVVFALWLLTVVALIANKFWYYWSTLL